MKVFVHCMGLHRTATVNCFNLNVQRAFITTYIGLSCVHYAYLSSFTHNRLHSCTNTVELCHTLHWNTSHHMASLVFRLYKTQFRPELYPGPRCGRLRSSPDCLTPLGEGIPLYISYSLGAYGASTHRLGRATGSGPKTLQTSEP